MVERRWLQPGDPAPSFVLPAVNRDGTVSLEDYRVGVRSWSACSGGFTDRSAGAGSCSWPRPRRS